MGVLTSAASAMPSSSRACSTLAAENYNYLSLLDMVLYGVTNLCRQFQDLGFSLAAPAPR